MGVKIDRQRQIDIFGFLRQSQGLRFQQKGKININAAIIQLRVKLTISSLRIGEGSIKKRKRKGIID